MKTKVYGMSDDLVEIETKQNIYLDLKAKEKEWLQTFNTDSATECFTAVQRLKESLNDRLDASYKG